MERQRRREPLPITITAAGRENLLLRQLVRQVLPMLEEPEDFHPTERQQVAQSLRFLLEGVLSDEDLMLEETFLTKEREGGAT